MIQLSLKGKGVFYSEWNLQKPDGLAIIEKAAKREETIEQAWFQPDFYPLKLSTAIISQAQDTEHSKTGLMLDTKNIVEIKVAGKKKQSISINNLYNEESLFPLYRTQLVQSKKKHVVSKVSVSVFETVEGLVKVFKIKEEVFDPSLLRFEFKVLAEPNVIILHKVIYNDKTLQPVKDKFQSVTGQQVFFK